MCFFILSVIKEEELLRSSQRCLWPPLLSPCSCTIENLDCGPEEEPSVERLKASLSNILQYRRVKEEKTHDLVIFDRLVPNFGVVELRYVHAPDAGCFLFFWSRYTRIYSNLERFEGHIAKKVCRVSVVWVNYKTLLILCRPHRKITHSIHCPTI